MDKITKAEEIFVDVEDAVIVVSIEEGEDAVAITVVGKGYDKFENFLLN